MATSLYDLSVPTFLQTISAIAGFLDRAAKHSAETSTDPDDFVDARLIDDMAPFHFQIEAAWHHRRPSRLSRTLESRRTGKSLAIRAQADRSAHRLYRRWHTLETRGKPLEEM